MPNVLNVAEKPSVAKSLAKILSSNGCTSRPGFSRYNQIYEFPFQLNNRNVRMVVTSVCGHLMEQEFDARYKSWTSRPPEELFDAPITQRVKEENQPMQRTLEQEARRSDTLVLWLDCDREGENIAFEVINVCRAVNNRLTVLRARFSALIPRDLFQACQNLGAPDQNASEAVAARQEIDLRIGSVFTRFLTLRIQRMFKDFKLVSYGPCQFPTLGFVVERYLERQGFRSEPFWKIRVVHSHGNAKAEFRWDRNRLFDRAMCLILYEQCVNNPLAEVVHCQSKTIHKQPPVPMSTVLMQKRASMWLRMSSHRTMQVAEKLYNDGFISYPRTETESFKDGFDLMSLIQLQTGHPDWGGYAQGLVAGAFNKPRRGRNDDNAHPPIHPTKADGGSLSGEGKKLYDFIVKHFLACCSKPAVGLETKATVRIATESFSTTGLIVKERNFLDVYPMFKWKTQTIPRYELNKTFVPDVLEMVESKTMAPPLLRESDLIHLMDSQGIGTDATIAEHIKKVQDRDYVEVKQGFFHPTPFGVALVEGYKAVGLQLSSPQLRAQMERDMKCIGLGTKTKQQVVQRCISQMRQAYQVLRQRVDTLDQYIARHYSRVGQNARNTSVEDANFSTCGDCGSMMQLKRDGSTQFLHCPQCDKSYFIAGRDAIVHHDPAFQCPICDFQVVGLQAQQQQPQQPGQHPHRPRAVCPRCFTDPPVNEVENAASFVGVGFTCKACTKPDCKLSNKRTDSQSVVPCRTCASSPMFLNCARDSDRYFVGCSNYPTCKNSIGLPNAKATSVSNEICARCSRGNVKAHKLKFRFAFGQMPPHFPLELVTCIGCDTELQEHLTVRGGNRGQQQSRQANGNRQNTNPNSRPNGNGNQRAQNARPPRRRVQPAYEADSKRSQSNQRQPRVLTCTSCLQQGHRASQCPQSRWAGGSQNQSHSSAANRVSSWGGNGNDAGGASGRGRSFRDSAKCFNCQQTGHFASDCPEKNRRGSSNNQWGRSAASRSDKVCFKCNLPGHFANTCPSNTNSGGASGRSSMGGGQALASVTCFKCQETGHYASSCPNQRASTGRGRGTKRRPAAKPRAGKRWSGSRGRAQPKAPQRCGNCQGLGHGAAQCPSPPASNHAQPVVMSDSGTIAVWKCYFCGGEHTPAECRNKP